uniref:Uncharacterized protein n=1 Tax=Arundo donax TaxID=35708 RepID=A0A0A9CRE2_ARUDO
MNVNERDLEHRDGPNYGAKLSQ